MNQKSQMNNKKKTYQQIMGKIIFLSKFLLFLHFSGHLIYESNAFLTYFFSVTNNKLDITKDI